MNQPADDPVVTPAEETTASPATARERHIKRLTTDAFDRQAGGGTYFDVLAEDVTWTIAAAQPSVHRGKQAFLDNGVRPVTDRLSTAIVPEIRSLWAQDDTVVIHWQGTAVARDGLPYRNNYCWIWKYRGDEVVDAIAFLDLVALNELFDRVALDGAVG